jgi:hypothetical protein
VILCSHLQLIRAAVCTAEAGVTAHKGPGLVLICSLYALNAVCTAEAGVTAHTGPGLVLHNGAAGAWDDRRVSGPVVRYWPAKQKYMMWYYGQSNDFYNKRMGPDAVSFPAGYIGIAQLLV